MPKEYIPAVDKGIQEAVANGLMAGYPIVDVKVKLVDGSYHEVDSSEMAFKIAGSMGFKEGFHKANPVLLEPMMKVEIVTPEDYLGDVMGDVSRRRGILQGQDDTPVGQDHQRDDAAGRNVRLRDHRCVRCRRAAPPSRWNSTTTPKRRPTSPKSVIKKS